MRRIAMRSTPEAQPVGQVHPGRDARAKNKEGGILIVHSASYRSFITRTRLCGSPRILPLACTRAAAHSTPGCSSHTRLTHHSLGSATYPSRRSDILTWPSIMISICPLLPLGARHRIIARHLHEVAISAVSSYPGFEAASKQLWGGI